jgi:ElaB/YqjD/DUF883 family membrane-anchored ribosome-binding protein
MDKNQSSTTDRSTGKLPGAETPGWNRPEPMHGAQGMSEGMKEVGEGIKNVASEIGQTTSNVAEDLKTKASNVAEEMKTKVQNAAQIAASKAEETKQAAGGQIQALAGKIREGGETVSDKAEQFGHYLQEHDFSAIGKDVTEIVRRYPMQSLLIGIGLGILLGRSAR